MTGRRIADIEVLRAAAILMVLYEHVPLNLLYWHSATFDFDQKVFRGAAGVELFFTISGFVIARSLLPHLQRATGPDFLRAVLLFWLRRFWRLQPAAWLWIAIPVLLGACLNRSGAFHTVHANLASGLTGLLAFTNIRGSSMGRGFDAGLNFPYWSLSLEEQFYLLLPVLAFLFGRRLGWAMLGLVLYQVAMPRVAVLGWTRPGAIAAGVLLAICAPYPEYRLLEPRGLARHAALRSACTLGLLALLGLILSTAPQPTLRVTFSVAVAVSGWLVYAASFDHFYIMGPGRIRDVLTGIGARSYALYLSHIPAYALARELMFRLHGPIFVHTGDEAAQLLSLGLCFTFAGAELSYRFVERPCRAYGRSLRLPTPLAPGMSDAKVAV